MNEKRKCGASPLDRLQKCPAILVGREPQTGDCQGCPMSVKTGTGPGWPKQTYKIEVPEVLQ